MPHRSLRGFPTAAGILTPLRWFAFRCRQVGHSKLDRERAATITFVEYLDFAIELASIGGEVLKHYMTREKQVELKSRANLVTIADKESEALVIRRINERYPNHAVLAEESGASGSGEGKWIIDPLDGTTNFAHQYPFFCVSIAFEQRGEILCGAVYDPVRDEMFSGARGLGSFVNGQQLRVSDTEKLGSA